MKRVIKTPGQRYFEETYPHFRWDGLSSSDRETYEVKANRLGIQPIEEDAPDAPLTDAELLWQAIGGTWFEHRESKIKEDAGAVAAEFLRLRAERDGDNGEPLYVTADDIFLWRWEGRRHFTMTEDAHVADRVNAHRGVRAAKVTKLPKVTAELCRNAHLCGTFPEMADYINAALAKAAKEGES